MGRRSPPHSARKKAHAEATPSTSHCKKVPCAQHTHNRNERKWARPIPRRSPLLPLAPTDWNYASQQVLAGGVPHSQMRHGAHSPLPSKCTQQAGAQSHPCHRNGKHKQSSSSRAIGAYSRKEERNGGMPTAQPAVGNGKEDTK
ncbi:hypothetical protein TcCL_Unassigned01715 [Trypanosoma cruzi]|nr:hypothetical protein TcCL_Unassigned01715 [Trypanosoma cruzi]